MAGIGGDIKDVLQELGTPFVLVKLDGSELTGESLDYEMYYEQSTEFIRQFAYSGDFQYDSQVEGGDMLVFDNKHFLVMNVKKTLFENEPVDHSNFFIETNTLGRISRGGEVRDPITKEIVTTWATVLDNVYGTMVSLATADNDMGSVNTILDRFTLFTQGFSSVRPGDRWYPDVNDLTEYYQIMMIDKYRFTGLLTLKLIEDARK